MKKLYTYDVEIYSNYLLFKFQNVKTKAIRYLEVFNGIKKTNLHITLRKFLTNKNNTFISFNGINFDAIMIDSYLKGNDTQSTKAICDHIINTGSPHWKTRKKFNMPQVKFDHIDLKESAPSVMISLKMYGARMGMPTLQDLPIEPDATLTRNQADAISTYCDNDLDTTTALYLKISKAIDLRTELSEKYDVDMRSKSDAQMAESIISSYMDVSKRIEPVIPFNYTPRPWLKFESPELNEILKIATTVKYQLSEKGALLVPKELSKAFSFNGVKYKIGIGGIHTQEKAQAIIAKSDEMLGEHDLSSMYPVIITEQNLFPKHLGRKFLDVYNNILTDRLQAKREGNKVLNETYKITLNGSYGKFGSQYSFLFSPELLIQTTITGQLAILMIIERLTKIGVRIVSANTDGINILHKKSQLADVESVIFEWELETGYNFEYTPYTATYNESVNSYIALKPDGSSKGKGFYATGSLAKNPDADICVNAVIDYLNKNIPVEKTINECSDIRQFLTARNVSGGAVYKGEVLGKVVRFYHSTATDCIKYKNGNKVAKSDNCTPLMTLCEGLPDDLDVNWYIDEAYKKLKKLGVDYVRK